MVVLLWLTYDGLWRVVAQRLESIQADPHSMLKFSCLASWNLRHRSVERLPWHAEVYVIDKGEFGCKMDRPIG